MLSVSGGYTNDHEGSSNLMRPGDHMNFSSELAHDLNVDKSLDKNVSYFFDGDHIIVFHLAPIYSQKICLCETVVDI